VCAGADDLATGAVQPALRRGSSVDREDEAGERPEVGERLQLVSADRRRRSEVFASVVALERGVSSSVLSARM